MIEVKECSKTYRKNGQQGAIKALDRISLDIREGEFVALLGPSGCGKTTLLKIIGGLLSWDHGDVLVEGRRVAGPGPNRAMVFQNFALMPWANVLTNVAFGLELRGTPRDVREAVAMRLIKTLGLEGFERSYPRHLSGGMQQRVGLARALAVDPRILLMDEPFGSLDAQTRRLMQEDLLQLQEEDPRTVVFVTHNMAEAVRLADRVMLMTARPGQVREIIDVPFERPRADDLEKEPAFAELKAYLWSILKAMQGNRAGAT